MLDASMSLMPNLTETHRVILDFERQWFRHEGAKEGLIFARIGISPTRYYQVLGWLVDQPHAMEYAPTVCARVRRLRETRRAARSA